MTYEFLSGSVSLSERKLWTRLSQGDLTVLENIYDLNANTYFAFILEKVKSREIAGYILLQSFGMMLEKQGKLSDLELSKFLFDAVVSNTINFESLVNKQLSQNP